MTISLSLDPRIESVVRQKAHENHEPVSVYIKKILCLELGIDWQHLTRSGPIRFTKESSVAAAITESEPDENEWQCPNCGTYNKGNNDLCTQCDYIHDPTTVEEIADESEEADPPKKYRGIFYCHNCGMENPEANDKCSVCHFPTDPDTTEYY